MISTGTAQRRKASGKAVNSETTMVMEENHLPNDISDLMEDIPLISNNNSNNNNNNIHSNNIKEPSFTPENLPLSLQPVTLTNGISAAAVSSLTTIVTTTTTSTAGPGGALSPVLVQTATVRRHYFGTGPFDKHWLNMDCCGLFCALFTYGLHLYGAVTVTTVLLPPWMSTVDDITKERQLTLAGQLNLLFFWIITIIAMVSHFKAMTTDPGAVPPDAKPLPLDNEDPQQAPRRLCRRCKAFKPQRAHHCGICRRCIIKMDHHCPWVNNCVGIGNHKYFLLFVFYTFISCVYCMVLVITRFSTCVGGSSRRHAHRHSFYNHADAAAAASVLDHSAEALQQQHRFMLRQSHEDGTHRYSCLDKPTHLLNVLLLLIEALLFGMFTSCMMFDQLEVIRSKMTHIDRLKGAEVGGPLAGIAEVFGLPPAFHSSQQQQPQPQQLTSSQSQHSPLTLHQSSFLFKRRSSNGGRSESDVSSSAAVDDYSSYNRFRPDWLSPFVKVCFPPNLHSEIMGFCRPISAVGNRGDRTMDASRGNGTLELVQPMHGSNDSHLLLGNSSNRSTNGSRHPTLRNIAEIV